jgi:tetratricopeptide (TPR) repeat protein
MTGKDQLELDSLLTELKSAPTNTDLINSIALTYYENVNLNSNHKDYEYFKMAYETDKTVKSAHNFAWYLNFEWGEPEKAIKIQKESIELNPKTFYPYYQFGFMLLDQKLYKESISYLEKAAEMSNRKDILHNLGCAYFHIGKYKEAKHCFSKIKEKDDIENISKYALALTEFQLKNKDKFEDIVMELESTIRSKVHQTISGYEIGEMFYYLNNHQKAVDCVVKQGLQSIEIYEWSELSYSLNKIDNETWIIELNKYISKRQEWISELNENHEEWSHYSSEEKRERKIEMEAEVVEIQALITNGIKMPSKNIKQNIMYDNCGCLLFGCETHGNIGND